MFGFSSCEAKAGSLFIFYFFSTFKKLLYFRFWGTCADCAGLLHRYTHAMMLLPPSPHHLHYVFLLMSSLPNPPTPHCPSPISLWQTQCVITPPCVHVFSLFNTHLGVRTCGVWFSVFVSVCWEWWFPGSSMSLQRTWTHRFWWLHNIPWCICATFFLSSLSSMCIWVGSRSLLLWALLQ